jgi:UDP-N-acetylmuramoyl-tripeptide--D-alanyl-D-alanine ligase
MVKKIVSKNILNQPRSFKRLYGELKKEQYDLCFDSRIIEPDQTFFALRGEKFDASSFIPEVLKKNPSLIITDNSKAALEFSTVDCPFIVCEDTVTYLQELAHIHMLHWKKENPEKKVIGITGSNGKTTTKEMLFHFLDCAFPGEVIRTLGNLNNHIGVPFTLLSAQINHHILIIEMGTNHPGEIKVLCDLAMPDAGIITSIGQAHLEFFKTVENVFKEKKNLCNSVRENTKGLGPFVINKEDPYLAKIEFFEGLKTFGELDGDFRISFSDQTVTVENQGEKVVLKNENILGKHNFRNLVASFLLAATLYPWAKEKFIKASKSFKPTSNRSSWVEKGERKFFLDAYNANPASMKASLEGFIDFLKKSNVALSDCYFVLGDMNELGENAPRLHEEIGFFLRELGVSYVAFIGKYSVYYNKGFNGVQNIFDSKKSFEKEWEKISKKFKFFFIKASRSLQLESLLDIN